VIEPIKLELTVACSPKHAFEVWAVNTTEWWPHDHSVSGDRGLTVTFEAKVGGRIYERTSDGVEDGGEEGGRRLGRRRSPLGNLLGLEGGGARVDQTCAIWRTAFREWR